MATVRLKNLLDAASAGPLQKVVQNAQIMDELTTRVRASLEPELAAALVAASIRDDQDLVLIAATPAWAARLRYAANTALETAAAAGFSAARCRVIVSRDGVAATPGGHSDGD